MRCRSFKTDHWIKKYDAELVALGVPQERIRHYGFAFAGKNVLIEQNERNG